MCAQNIIIMYDFVSYGVLIGYPIIYSQSVFDVFG